MSPSPRHAETGAPSFAGITLAGSAGMRLCTGCLLARLVLIGPAAVWGGPVAPSTVAGDPLRFVVENGLRWQLPGW